MKDIFYHDLTNAIILGNNVESKILEKIGTTSDFVKYFHENNALLTDSIIKDIVVNTITNNSSKKYIFDSGTIFSLDDFINRITNQYITVINTIIQSKEIKQQNTMESTADKTKVSKKKIGLLTCFLLVILYFVGKMFLKKSELGQAICDKITKAVKDDDDIVEIKAETND